MKKLFSLSFLLFLLVSCQPILKKMYGIKNPDIENDKTIKKKALKYGLDTANIVTVNSKDYPAAMKGKSFPDAAIYDNNGKYIEYRQTDSSCNAGLFKFIPELHLTGNYNKPDSLPLNAQLNKYRDTKGNALKEIEKSDFYILIFWTVWTGKLNKDHVKIWEDLSKNNKNCHIKVLKVNLDLQEYWDKNDRERIIKAMSKKK